MICKPCAKAGRVNRRGFNEGLKPPWLAHPKDCGCPCMHKDPTQWEDMFSVKEPYEVHE